ncbi:hypothetical protein K2173_022725 [Erythroxylum novogranatense]|uniref:Pentatricopeptide repeat-containing protein n=1 Tax=Erythroxylum novogranatense TaxID=1862640 RepID=A0AAV8SNB9_9ROSI|nr:hypothetical protein K2173_022725 [Erythroxylum novogranatense]
MFIQFQLLVQELSKSYQSLLRTRQLHALIIRAYLVNDPFYPTKIVRFYALNNDLCSARNLFDKTPQRSIFLWNSIIRAHAQAGKFVDAFSLYRNMLGTDIKPDSFTFACLIRACYESSDLDGLRLVHGGAIVSGLGLDSVTCSALVTAYSKISLVGEASKIFARIFEPDLVLWNSMISGFSYWGFWDKGLQLFNQMRFKGNQQLDSCTFVGLISGLGDSNFLGLGQEIHGLCMKSGLDCNTHVGSALVSMYSRFNCMSMADRVFRNLHYPDLVTWSALITGYSRSGEHQKALLLYMNLNWKGERADPVLIASVLVAVSNSANVRPGREIHGYLLRHGSQTSIMVSSALVDMYFKCGFVGLGIRAFENMPIRNVISYNSVISGLGLHGLASEAFKMFEDMLEKGLSPDESSFSSLLCACCHAGLVEDGREIFRRMIDEFGIQPKTKHYVHLIKLLGLAGKLEEAYNLISSLMHPVDPGIWGALLSCCHAHGNSELAEAVSQQLLYDEPEKGAYRVMISNIYACDGRWSDVEKMRHDMTNVGARKTTGHSWVALNM